MKHPAKFTTSILAVCEQLLEGREPVLDMFAGTGLIHTLPQTTIGVEIEPDWATMRVGTLVGDALRLPFRDGSFPAACTSPVYGNRMSDCFKPKDKSVRHSYTFDIGHQLHANNAGMLQWGAKYRSFHEQAWAEARRVLQPDGIFLLNIKDHFRNLRKQPVSGWHVTTLCRLGFTLIDVTPVRTPGLRYGANRERVPFEWVFSFQR